MNKIEPLDMKDSAIIAAFPVHDFKRTILNVGCGDGRLDYHLASMGYKIYATDILKDKSWINNNQLIFSIADIFNLSSFPINSVPVVICSQVLEHLKEYKKALINLLKLAKKRLIITVPYQNSFFHPKHINFWDDNNIGEFKTLCEPYNVSISKIITKIEDGKTGQRDYLITINKR